MSQDKDIHIAIVDYGICNMYSVKHACEKVGLHASITSSVDEIAKSDGVISKKRPACRLLLYRLTSPVPSGLTGTWGNDGFYNAQAAGPVPSGMDRWGTPQAKI